MKLALALAIPLLAALPCAGWMSAPRPRLAHELTLADQQAADGLAANLVSGRFPSEVAKDCGLQAKRFTWLAANRDAEVARAALLAATACATSAPETVDLGDLALAAAVHVPASEPELLLAAVAAADLSVAAVPEHHLLVARLVGRAFDPDPRVRYEILPVLDRRAWSQEPLVGAAFLAELHEDEAPWLVSEALRRVRFRAAGLRDPWSFRRACLLLTNDLDPGIRGRAALVLARIAPDDPEIRDVLVRLLDDGHGFTRSAAAEALAELGATRAIPLLVQRLDDSRANTWEMLPFTRLGGEEEVVRHVGSHFERVDDAYLRALVELSAPMGDDRFVYREVNLRWRELDIVAATRDAERWFEAQSTKIPTD